jgi:hypothetical protein
MQGGRLCRRYVTAAATRMRLRPAGLRPGNGEGKEDDRETNEFVHDAFEQLLLPHLVGASD